jgi:hypothetical protein
MLRVVVAERMPNATSGRPVAKPGDDSGMGLGFSEVAVQLNAHAGVSRMLPAARTGKPCGRWPRRRTLQSWMNLGTSNPTPGYSSTGFPIRRLGTTSPTRSTCVKRSSAGWRTVMPAEFSATTTRWRAFERGFGAPRELLAAVAPVDGARGVAIGRDCRVHQHRLPHLR